jgi:hypothetical protein
VVNGWPTSPLFEPVKESKNEYPDYGVRQSRDSEVTPVPLHRLTQEAMRHTVVHTFLNTKEDERDQEPRTRIIDIDLHPQRRGQIADDRERDAVHPERMVVTGEEILQQSDKTAGQAAADGIAPCGRKENRYQATSGMRMIAGQLNSYTDTCSREVTLPRNGITRVLMAGAVLPS